MNLVDMGTSVIQEPGLSRSQGLSCLGQPELLLLYSDESLAPLAADMTTFIATYVEENGAKLRSGEKMATFTSMIRFQVKDGNTLVEGLEFPENQYVENLDFVLTSLMTQAAMCGLSDSAFTAPALVDSCVASDAFLNGAALGEAVRYPYSAPNSGWYFFDEAFNGNEKLLRKVHIGDVLLLRPDLISYLALEPGFCVDLRRANPVWHEIDVAEREPV